MLIIGAGGFALECLEILFQNNYNKEIYFFDNVNEFINPFIENNYKVVRSFEELNSLDKNTEFILGLGNPSTRFFFHTKLTSEYNLKSSSLISDKSIIGKIENKICSNVNIMTGVVITSQCEINNGVLINLNSTIGHNTTIEQFVEICPGVNISGNCIIEEGAFIGTGANLLPGIKIGKGAIIAAGAVVTKNVKENTMVAGNPAIFKKEVEKKW
jgi:sugar O-acyltransferase (sialic acid O-acetyltransferase NeuD family)